MTNKQFLVNEIKTMLKRDDLDDGARVKLLGLLSKHVPQTPVPPAPSPSKPVKAAKPATKGPFQRPAAWLDEAK